MHFHDSSDTRLKSYLMGKKLRPHRFCPECGSSVLIDFKDADIESQKPLLAMNVRAIPLSLSLSLSSYIYITPLRAVISVAQGARK